MVGSLSEKFLARIIWDEVTKICVDGLFSKTLRDDFLIFCMILKDSWAHQLKQMATHRNFKGEFMMGINTDYQI